MKFFQSLQKTALNIIHDKVLASLLALSLGLFAGVVLYQTTALQASLIQIPTTLEESEVLTSFTDYQNIKDVEVSALTNNTFLVEFFATEGEGDSLHPFSFVVEKENNTLVGIQEISNDVQTEEFIEDAQNIEVSPL